MRVDLNNVSPGENAQGVQSTARAGGSQGNTKPANDGADSSDHLSATSLTNTVAQLPEVRQEKVAALAERVRNGQYQVSAQQTADAILSQIRQRQAA